MGRTAKNDLLQGTLDVLILKTLQLGPDHGWGISQRIRQMSSEVLQVNQGSLYPALHRLERWARSRRPGRVGQQPAGEVLPAHQSRRTIARARNRELDASVGGRHTSAANRVG